ncbi:MAG: phosphotransferase [Bacteroidota bacterium]
MLLTGCRMRDAGCRMQDVRDAGCRMQDAGWGMQKKSCSRPGNSFF